MVEREFKNTGAPRHPRVADVVADARRHIEEGTPLPFPSLDANANVYGMARATWKRALEEAGVAEATYELIPKAPKPRDANRRSILERFEACIAAGEAPPSLAVLSQEHGISVSNILYLIDEKGLQGQLRELRKNAKTAFAPSQDAAWFLGMLAGTGGSVSLKDSEVRFTNKKNDPDLVAAFNRIGGKLLAERGKPKEGVVYEDQKKGRISFFSRKGSRELGGFSSFNKQTTLQEKHPWTLELEYLPSLLAGIIDSGGLIKPTGKLSGIHFYSKSTLPLLTDYFPCVGVQHPSFKYESAESDPMGMIIWRPSDLRAVAENIIGFSESPRIQTQIVELVKQKETRANREKPKEIFPG